MFNSDMEINNQHLAQLLDRHQLVRAMAGAEMDIPKIARLTDTPYPTAYRVVKRQGELHTGMNPEQLKELAMLLAERRNR